MAVDFTDIKGLTMKQKEFIRYYVTELNGTHAAISAGYAEKNADVAAAKLLKNPKIKQVIDEILEQRAIENAPTAEKVIAELSLLAFQTNRIAPKDKLKALELLGKHFALFTDKVEQTGPQQIKVTLPPELEDALKK